MIRVVGIVLAVTAGLAGASVARANPMDVFGFGARASGMGQAVTADVEDFGANYHNPAGLVRSEELRLHVGYFGAGSGLQVNGQDSDVDGVRGLTFGIVAPARFGNVDVAFGIAGHLPDRVVSRTLGRPANELRWLLYDNRPHRIYLASHLAIRPFRWLLIGGGIAFQSRSSAQLGIRGRIAVDGGGLLGGAPLADPEVDSRLEHQLRGELNTIRYPQVGIQIVPNDRISFGAVYRGEFDLRVRLEADIDAQLDARVLPGLPGLLFPAQLALISDAINAFQAQQVSFGVSTRPTDRLTVNVEVTWVDWSSFRSPIGLTEIRLAIDVPPSLGINVPDDVVGSQPIPAGFRDRWIPRVGVEYAAVQRTSYAVDLRAGYFFERSPMPAQTGLTNFLDSDRHTMSVGAGVALLDLEPTLRGFLRFDTFVQYSRLMERVTVKDSLTGSVGDHRFEGHIVAAGVNMEVAFQ